MPARQITSAAVVLGLFAIIGTGMVVATYEGTRGKIAENERMALLNALYTIVPRNQVDNQIHEDVVLMSDRELFATDEQVPVYIARKDSKPIAAIFQPVAPDGYSGHIRLLVGISTAGVITGVRVVAHKETPGLGDLIEARKSDWIKGFNDKSLHTPSEGGWAVKKDGGEFDQFTGATISPRTVVRAVHRTLKFFAAHRDRLFAPKEEAQKDG